MIRFNMEPATPYLMVVERYLNDMLGSYNIWTTSWKQDVEALNLFGVCVEQFGNWVYFHFSSEQDEFLFRLTYL